jgi:hypothetical protein
LTPVDALAEPVGAAPSLLPEKVRAVLAEFWPNLHAPLRHHHSSATVVALFRRAGYVTDGATMPDTDLVIYRGEHPTVGPRR